jgi:DNA-binding MarR family transcriptional regulator
MSATETAGTDVQTIAAMDHLVHEPARLMILTILYVVESADFLYLMRQTGLTRGNLSSHLSKLEAAEYIDVKKEFIDKIPRTLLRLTDTGWQAFQTYRQDVIQVLENLAD